MGSWRTQTIIARKKEGWHQHYSLSYNQARCMHPPFVECYAVQAFSITFNFDSTWWEKFASSYNPFFYISQITIIATARIARNITRFSPWYRGINIVHDIINVEQHKLFGINVAHQLHNVTPNRQTCLQSRFFQATAAAEAIRTLCQACFESPVSKGQCILCMLPGEQELKVVQEAWTWHPIPLRAYLFQQPAKPLHERIQSGTQHLFPIQFLSRPRKVTGPRKVMESLTALAGKQSFTHSLTTTFGLEVGLQARKVVSCLLFPHPIPQQGSAQVNQSFSKPVALQIRHP